jgi:hypothetical protein
MGKIRDLMGFTWACGATEEGNTGNIIPGQTEGKIEDVCEA